MVIICMRDLIFRAFCTSSPCHRRRDAPLEIIFLLAQINVTGQTPLSARSAIFNQMSDIANTFLNSELDTEAFFPANSARTGPAGMFCFEVSGYIEVKGG
jgi:hypothetical protein